MRLIGVLTAVSLMVTATAPKALAQTTTPLPTAPRPVGSGNQPEVGGTPQSSGQPAFQGTPDQGNPSIQSSLGPYGDPGGTRAVLARRGLTYTLVGILEALGNPTGGERRVAIGEGRLDLQVDLDLKTAVGLDGASLHGNGYAIFGHGLSGGDIRDLSLASGIEALPSTRLYEVWYEQAFLDGKAALRLGQLGADTEFLVSQYATLFINATYGWPNITSYDLPSGGPAYPLAAPGARLKIAPDAHWSLISAVFDGDPSGASRFGAAADPQVFDPTGTNFRVTDAPFSITEAAYAYGDKDGGLLPGILKLGGWEHFGSFAGTIPTAAGATLGSGTGRFSGNDGIYGMVDQMIYRVPGTEDGAVGVFARLSGSPGDRNLVSFYADAGVTGKASCRGDPTTPPASRPRSRRSRPRRSAPIGPSARCSARPIRSGRTRSWSRPPTRLRSCRASRSSRISNT